MCGSPIRQPVVAKRRSRAIWVPRGDLRIQRTGISDIRKLCSDARVLKGIPIRGGSVQGAANDIANWLRELGEIE